MKGIQHALLVSTCCLLIFIGIFLGACLSTVRCLSVVTFPFFRGRGRRGAGWGVGRGETQDAAQVRGTTCTLENVEGRQSMHLSGMSVLMILRINLSVDI